MLPENQPVPHRHSPDNNYSTAPILKHLLRSTMWGVFHDWCLVSEHVCKTCRSKYVEEYSFPGEVLSFIQSNPKAAKELGFTSK